MGVQAQIDKYIAEQDSTKREDLEALHRFILMIAPDCRLWFLDGRNDEGKIVSNENIGYGSQTLKYVGGGVKEFYRVGLSANAAGISIYLIGIDDKKYLLEAYGQKIGRAKVTGYCVRFRHLKDINIEVLEEMIAKHMNNGAD